MEKLGELTKIGDYDFVQELRPRGRDNRLNSYSSRFGFGSFPMHTDFAHWFIPPRYVVLRCVVGAKDVKTQVLDGGAILKKLGKEQVERALV
jgi:hypothetical protein